MATSIAEIEQYLYEEGLKFKKDKDEYILIGYNVATYANRAGRHSLDLSIRLEEDGRYIKLIAPFIYKFKDSPHQEAVLQACLQASWMNAMVKFAYDQEDGEIRAVVEFPVEDADFTRRQLVRMIREMIAVVDKTYPMIREASATGKMIIEKGLADLAVLVQLDGAVEELGFDEVQRLIDQTAND